MSETQTSPVVNERFEQEAAKHLTVEQKVQSEARGGVLKYLDGDAGLNPQQQEQLHTFADMAAQKALAEYEGLKQQDPALAAESVISENSALFQDYYGFAKANVDRIDWMRNSIAESARRLKGADTNGELTQEDLIAKIGVQSVDVRMEEPKDPGKFDTNLAFLKVMGAVPDDVTNLPKFIGEMPSWTPADNEAWQQNGEPSRAVQTGGGPGYGFRDLPTKIDGVYVSGARLYSTDTKGSGQWGFGLTFSGQAVERILESKTVEDSHSK